jgi:hypothetical protein
MRIGTTVLYVLSASDVAQINRRRTTSDEIKNRMGRNPPEWPAGAMAHVGEIAHEGDLVPLLITRETPEGGTISGQAFLNGSDTYWVPACELVVDAAPAPGQATTLGDQVGFEVQREIDHDRGGKRAASR